MDQQLNLFLDKVLRQIINTSGHDAIKDELVDHYYSVKEELVDNGALEEDASHEALKHLGDPKTIGKQLNNIWFPQLKWFLHWLVATGLVILFYLYLPFYESSLSASVLYFPVVAISLCEFMLYGATFKYFYSYYKKSDLQFVRVYHQKKVEKSSLSYVEKLTNRLAIFGGLVFTLLLIVAFVGESFETHMALRDIAPLIGFATIFYRVFLSIKLQKSPIVIIDHKGIWIQGVTAPYLKWHKIKAIRFYTDYKKQFLCELTRPGNKMKISFVCLPLDQSEITHYFEKHTATLVNTQTIH